MKKFLLLFLLFCVSSNFYAQELTYNSETRHFYLDEAVLSDQSFLEYAQLNCQDAALVFKKYRNEYRAGLGLMVAGGTLMATGAVNVKYANYIADGPKAIMYINAKTNKPEKVVFMGRSKIVEKGANSVEADKITMTMNPKTFEAIGNVKTYIDNNSSNKNEKMEFSL